MDSASANHSSAPPASPRHPSTAPGVAMSAANALRLTTRPPHSARTQLRHLEHPVPFAEVVGGHQLPRPAGVDDPPREVELAGSTRELGRLGEVAGLQERRDHHVERVAELDGQRMLPLRHRLEQLEALATQLEP